jgi:hypothetical protein
MVAPRQWKINLHLIHRQRIVSSSLHDTVGETYTNEKKKKLSWGDEKICDKFSHEFLRRPGT